MPDGLRPVRAQLYRRATGERLLEIVMPFKPAPNVIAHRLVVRGTKLPPE